MSQSGSDQVLIGVATQFLNDRLKDAWDFSKAKSKKYDISGYSKKYAKNFIERYNRLKIIGMTEPVSLADIYVQVNILEKITSRIRLTPEDMEAWEKRYRQHRSFGKIKEKTIDGLKLADSKQHIMLLGQPGAGKSTFLKHIGLQAIQDKLEQKRIPVFISLKELADSPHTLLEFITEEFDTCRFPDAESFIERQLENGNLLLLLDGLDEVGKSNINKVYKDVNSFSDKYSQNQFIISCRTAAYNQSFTRFTDVELAEFGEKEINSFVTKWFGNNKVKADACQNKIKQNKPILELAQNPLLLTLLCLAFDETMDFPANRAELYKEAIDALLKKWLSSKNIPHEEIYRHLSAAKKENMLSRIAYQTFNKERYFVRQDILEKQIAEFIENLPEAKADTITDDSAEVLKDIEAQHGILVERTHGIYSFSHLTFQEYFTARYIVDNAAKEKLPELVENITDRRWYEVFILTAGMLPEADEFLQLMKKKADALIQDNELKKLLSWAKNKAGLVKDEYISASLRSFYIYICDYENYFAFVLAIDLDTNSFLSSDFAHAFNYSNDFALKSKRPPNLFLVLELDLCFKLKMIPEHTSKVSVKFHEYDFTISSSDDFQRTLKYANKMKLDSLIKPLEKLQAQKKIESITLGKRFAKVEELREVMIRELNIGHKFDLNEKQAKCLNNYIYANKLIVDCLNCQGYVSKGVREGILDQLLIPPNL